MNTVTKKRILVVDDEEFNFVMLRQSMGDFFTMEYAESGRDCLSAAIAKKPDAILLDVCMPGLDGYDTCRLLKNTPETQHIPIVMVSGLESEAEKQAGFEAGCDEYIVKPFSVSELLEVVHTFIIEE